MTTEQQPVITNSGSSNSNPSNLNHQRKASGRNTSSRHSSACGGGQWYANGEPGGMQFLPTDVPLGFAPPLLATGFYAQPPGALFDYGGMLNSPDMNAWAASDMQHILSGAPIYDPVYSGGFLSPTLVNPAAFTPVNGPPFAYDANELYSACGMTPTPTGVPNFPFDPSLNLAAAPWDGFAAPGGDYAAWQASNGAQLNAAPDSQLLLSAGVSSHAPNGNADASGNVNSAPNQVVGESAPNGSGSSEGVVNSSGEVTAAASGRPQQTAAGSHSSTTGRGVEHVTGQMALLRVANAASTSSATSNGATTSYAAALLSKVPQNNVTTASNDASAPKLADASADQTAIDAALFKPDETVSKGKFLSVAKRREVTYAGVVKAGANETNDAKSASASASSATQNVNGFGSSPFVAQFGASARTQLNGVATPVPVATASPWLSNSEESPEVLLERLKASVNPATFEVTPGSRFFVIKSYSEDDVHRSIKYGIWCSTVPGNQKLDAAYRAVNALADRRGSRDAKNSANANANANANPNANANVAANTNIAPQKTVVGLTYPINQSQVLQKGTKSQPDGGAQKQSDGKNAQKTEQPSQPGVFLFFSVNGSGHFCGVAEMVSTVDYETRAGVWEQDKWRGKLDVRWHFVKDVPNAALRNVRLENNENKPVTNSRDTQEVPIDKARQVLQVFATYPHTTSLFDDFLHYERKQLEATRARTNPSANWNGAPQAHAHAHAHAHAAWRSTAEDWNANANANANAQTQPQPQTSAEWYPASGHTDWHTRSNTWGTKAPTARSADWHAAAAATGNDEAQNGAFAFGYLPAATRPDAPPS